MHKLAIAGLAVGMVLLFAPSANAVCVWCDDTGCHVTTGPCPSAPPPPPHHRNCKKGTSEDPTGTLANPGTQVGVMTGGPYVLADLMDSESNPMSAMLTCSVQVGGTGTYAEADASTVSASGTGVVYLPPTLISYQATAADAVWECTTITVRNASGAWATYYEDSVTGEFSTDATTAKCDLAISQEIPPEEVCAVAPDVCALPPVKP